MLSEYVYILWFCIHSIYTFVLINEIKLKKIDNYPQAKDFEKYIERGDLYVDREDNIITGFICVNYIEPVESKIYTIFIYIKLFKMNNILW